MHRPNDKSQIILVIITAILVVINISLIIQNLNLKSDLNALTPMQMEVGEVVDEFQSKDLSGSEKKITCPGDDCKRVFLFFKTTCTYCEKQMAFWKSLVSQIDDRNYRVTAITAESDAQAIKDYMKSHEIDNWEVLTIKPEDAQKAKLLVTPITFVTDNRGTIERVWIGLWQPRDADSASSYFSISSLSTANPN